MKISKRDFFAEAYANARAAGLNDTQARLAASQAALETGYGKSVVGNNYFGIKAGKSWGGPSVTAGTWEDTAAGPVRERARFRSYSNPANAFSDWASTVSRKWSDAFNAPTFNEAVEGLDYGQPGGYATDRNYGSKLRAINARYGPQADQVDGIMSAVNPPATVTPMARPMSLAEQYGLLDTARGLNRDIGLLRKDVAEQDPMGQLRRDLLAREAAYKMATAPAPGVEPASIENADVPLEVAYAPTASASAGTPAPASVGGLLSPAEQAAVRQQQMNLADMGPNRRVQLGQMAKKGLGAFGGGLLGGMLLGPLGAVAGGLLGPTVLNSVTQTPNYPKRPESTPKGDGKMNDYGRSVERESRQFRDAVASGRGGLW